MDIAGEATSERLEQAAQIEKILLNNMPSKGSGSRVYITRVKGFFDAIKAFRKRGFSFVQICAAFEEAGILPDKSSPDSFRRAFSRELDKRAKTVETACLNKPVVKNLEKSELDDKAAMDEKIKKMFSIETKDVFGNKIIKYSDGSFDY